MSIEFQISFAEWLEWKRGGLSKFRLAVLRIAEAAWIPLCFLCAVSVVVSVLQVLNPALVASRFVPGWLPIPILVMMAAVQIFLSTVPTMRRSAVKKDWLAEVANEHIKVELTETGFEYVSEKAAHSPLWSEVAEVFQSKSLLMFCDADHYTLLIPKRAFSAEQLREFLKVAYQKTVTERSAHET